MAATQQAQVTKATVNPPTAWICRETKERFSSTRAAAKHAGVTASAMSFALRKGLKFYHSRANGHTYFVAKD